MTPLYLADKSALARVHVPAVGRRLGPLIADGYVATCPVIDLEVLFSARSRDDYDGVLSERLAMPSYPVNEAVLTRSMGVQRLLAQRGQHRLPVLDLIIASVAEINDLTVLHYDADFDRIAQATSQPTEWIAPRGSL